MVSIPIPSASPRDATWTPGLISARAWAKAAIGRKWDQGLKRTCPRDIMGHDAHPRVQFSREKNENFILDSENDGNMMNNVNVSWICSMFAPIFPQFPKRTNALKKPTSCCWHLSWRLQPPGTKIEPGFGIVAFMDIYGSSVFILKIPPDPGFPNLDGYFMLCSPGIVPFQPDISVFLLHWDDSFASASRYWNWQVLEYWRSQVWWATSDSCKSHDHPNTAVLLNLCHFTTFCRGKWFLSHSEPTRISSYLLLDDEMFMWITKQVLICAMVILSSTKGSTSPGLFLSLGISAAAVFARLECPWPLTLCQVIRRRMTTASAQWFCQPCRWSTAG